jgi:hypothetical protein
MRHRTPVRGTLLGTVPAAIALALFRRTGAVEGGGWGSSCSGGHMGLCLPQHRALAGGGTSERSDNPGADAVVGANIDDMVSMLRARSLVCVKLRAVLLYVVALLQTPQLHFPPLRECTVDGGFHHAGMIESLWQRHPEIEREYVSLQQSCQLGVDQIARALKLDYMILSAAIGPRNRDDPFDGDIGPFGKVSKV